MNTMDFRDTWVLNFKNESAPFNLKALKTTTNGVRSWKFLGSVAK